MWKKRIKKAAFILPALLLFPYIVTVLIHGFDREEESLLDLYGMQTLKAQVFSDDQPEMIKAQAVIVRTNLYREVQEKEGKTDFDIANLSTDFEKEITEAWKQTDGEILLYEDKPAFLPFHRLSNGRTRSASETLGSEAYPYLVSVDCTKDVEAEDQIRSVLIDLEQAKVTKIDSAGYVMEVKVGNESVPAEQFRDAYDILSAAFILQTAEGHIRVTTSGLGHGLGLSQNTANEMAKDGKNYREILAYFFAGTDLKEVAEVLLQTE